MDTKTYLDHVEILANGSGAASMTITGRVAKLLDRSRKAILALKGVRLPPGELDGSDEGMFHDRLFLTRKTCELGPIFKLAWHGAHLTCIAGHVRGLRFLNEHDTRLCGASIRLDSLMPHGFLRNMTGAVHHEYRGRLNSPLRVDFSVHEHALRAIVRSRLQMVIDGSDLVGAISEVALGFLLLTIFGAEDGTPESERLAHSYRNMGPDGFVWEVGPAQIEAFVQLRGELDALIAAAGKGAAIPASPSVLQEVLAGGGMDETVAGNLVYMVEMGRYDLTGLLRWLVKYLSDAPEIAARIREGSQDGLATACVLEALRLNQSEALIRRVQSDIVFDRYLLPRGTHVHLCIWEGHKDPETFPGPYEFNPDRFIERRYEVTEYAPFGMNRHRCIAAQMSTRLAALFVEELCREFTWQVTGDGPTERGRFHWEPNGGFGIDLKRRHL